MSIYIFKQRRSFPFLLYRKMLYWIQHSDHPTHLLLYSPPCRDISLLCILYNIGGGSSLATTNCSCKPELIKKTKSLPGIRSARLWLTTVSSFFQSSIDVHVIVRVNINRARLHNTYVHGLDSTRVPDVQMLPRLIKLRGLYFHS